MQDLKLTFIQTEVVWEDINANIALFNEKISTICEAIFERALNQPSPA